MESSSTDNVQHISRQLSDLRQLLDPSEIIESSSEQYLANSQPWSTGKDLKPQLLVRPKSVESLAKLVRALYSTDLDYKVRSQGFGSASAKDVLISLSAFDDFEFDKDEEYVMLGAGGTWRMYYDRMQAAAPDWTIVCARTPSIGIGGSTLCSGFSWLSSEYGCVSDPANMLDARVITADGQIKWASSDPDLLWSLRGVECGFAIVTHFKFRARRYPQNGELWGGPILMPRTRVPEVAKGIMKMVEKDKEASTDGKTAMFLYVMRKEILAFFGATQDMLVVHAFDARGEEAGREEFAWALEMEGVVDQTKGNMTHSDVAALQEHAGELRGTAEMYWSAVALYGESQISEEVILKSFEWWESILEEPSSIAENGYLLYELFSCRDSLTGRHSSAWPRPEGYKHMMLLGSGCKPGSNPATSQKAMQYVIDAPMFILNKATQDVDMVPNCIEPYHNVDRIYGDHMPKLKDIKARLDPKNKLKGWIKASKDDT